MSKEAALEQYFKEAASWDADREAMSARSARLAWRIAIGACALTLVAILTLMMLMPLKRVEPFVIRVDNATGIVDVVPAFVGNGEFPELVTRYFPVERPGRAALESPRVQGHRVPQRA
ncbi:MAG: VirB8/TrbF family protein [Pseudomonadota bacterium]